MSVRADRFVELSKSEPDRQSFDCGQEPLNTFLQTRALKHQAVGISRTMVLSATSKGADGKYPIRVFYTLSSSVIERETLIKVSGRSGISRISIAPSSCMACSVSWSTKNTCFGASIDIPDKYVSVRTMGNVRSGIN